MSAYQGLIQLIFYPCTNKQWQLHPKTSFVYLCYHTTHTKHIVDLLNRMLICRNDYESSSSVTDAASDEQDALWHRRYYGPPVIYNGFYFILTIFVLNEKSNDEKGGSFKLKLFKYDTHQQDENVEEVIVNYSNINEQTLVNLCTHYMYQYHNFNLNMFILNSICPEQNFELKINSLKPIINKCKDVEIIKHYSLFLDETTLNERFSTIWKFQYNKSYHFLTKENLSQDNDKRLRGEIVRLHKKRKFRGIVDHVTGENYIIYYATEKLIYIVKSIAKEFKIAAINQYNIRKRRYLDLIIYNNLLLHLSHLSEYINILSLQGLNRLGRMRTFMHQSRFKTHLVLNKRLNGLHYISTFANINDPNKLIPDNILVIIDEYGNNSHHFKYEIGLINRVTNWYERDEEVLKPIIINMHEMISHLDYLCLLE